MLTTTHIQPGALRRAATWFILTAAIGGGGMAGMSAIPAQSSLAASGTAEARSFSYGWPVKPFDRQHPVRGSFGDPRSIFDGPPTLRGLMHSHCKCSFHDGIDISAHDLTPVYPVRSGVVQMVTHEWVRVDSGDGVAFEYWHIDANVKLGDDVLAGKTVLGRILRASGHVHLTELLNGKAVNPLAPGHIGPYADPTIPRVSEISFRAGNLGPELLPEYLHGRILMVASASDTHAIPVTGKWNGMPISPAKVTYRIVSFPQKQVVLPETVAMDVSRTLPDTSDLWHTYARGSHMNMVQMGLHRYWYQPGVYLFNLAHFDTRRLKDGVYQLVVTAWDTAGNHSSTPQIINVHNRKNWLR